MTGERARSTRLSAFSGVSSRHAKRGGAAPGAAPPRWWDVKARLETVLREDERSEFGYLEHDSEGECVFRARSTFNGDVRVVKHGPWRSLRFNEVEQGLSYVRETHRDEATGEVTGVTADVDVLGYEYLRCMTAAAAAMCALDAGADWRRGDARGVDGDFHRRPSVVCVGLGSGAMPAFIANAFPEIDVDVVEIDDVVVDAAERALGLPGIRTGAPERSAPLADRLGARGDALSRESERRLANLRVVVEDASAFMARAAGATRRGDAPPARAIFLDAFDGAGETPRHLTEPAFLRDCAARVRIGGVVVANCFNGARGSKARRGAESFAVALARAIGPVTSWTVETPVNVVFAARRGSVGAEKREETRFSRAQLRDAARELGAERQFEWDAGERVRRAFWVEVLEDVELAEGSETAKDAGAFPRAIRERPAGVAMNPLSALAGRMGTTMPREWAEDEEEEA